LQTGASTDDITTFDTVARWNAALESLDMQAFLAGYELDAFFNSAQA
jgi:hypothetical protein